MAAEPKPFSTKGSDPEALREKQVAKAEAKSFDERTSATPAWLDENGNQRNGAEDVTEPKKKSSKK